jgi:hypothetical protein
LFFFVTVEYDEIEYVPLYGYSDKLALKGRNKNYPVASSSSLEYNYGFTDMTAEYEGKILKLNAKDGYRKMKLFQYTYVICTFRCCFVLVYVALS